MKTAFRWFIFSVSHVEDFHGRAGRIEVWCFFVFECLFLVLAAGIDLLFTGFSDRPADLCGADINSYRSFIYPPPA